MNASEFSESALDSSLTRAPSEAPPVTWASGRVLRLIGGGLLIASFSTFLLRRWEDYSDISRYGFMLLHTVLLVLAALFCSFGIRENRGARTLLVLVLAAVPFNAAVLGGFVYSRHVWDDANLGKAAAFLWVAPSESALWAILGFSVPVLLGLAWFALKTLVRGHTSMTLTMFSAACALQLLPVRTPLAVAAMCIIGVGIIVAVELNYFAELPRLNTVEGRLVRGLLLLPFGLMLGRSAILYPDVSCVLGTLGICAGTLFAAVARREGVRNEMRLLAVPAALCPLFGWFCLWTDVAWVDGFADNYRLPALLLPGSVLLGTLAQLLPKVRRELRVAAALGVVVGTVPGLFIEPSATMQLFCLGIGLLCVLIAVHARSKSGVLAGGLTALSGLTFQVLDRVHVQVLSNWLVLSVMGLGLILLSSWIERNHLRLRAKWRGLRSVARAWDY